MKKAILWVLVLALVTSAAGLMSRSVVAFSIPNNLLKEYSVNGIYFMDPCGNGANNNRGNGCVGTLPGSDNAEMTWNAIVEANVDGVSNNPAAIAGIMGNLMQETGFDPFEVARGYYGIHMTKEQAFIDVINNAGLGQYWGHGKEAPKEAVKQAIELELDYIMKTNERFLGTGSWVNKGFMSYVNDSEMQQGTAEDFSDLFLVTVEDAYYDSPQSQWKGSNIILNETAKKVSEMIYGYVRWYQEAEVRRDNAKEFYEKYGSSGVCNLGGAFNGVEVTWEDLNPLSSNDRLKLLVETYGEFAMQLQKYYGIPWELPFAIMVMESQVGAGSSGDISHQAQADGNYNMMGLTDTVDGFEDKYRIEPRVCYYNRDGQCHSGYATISQMILGYTIYHARSGFGGDKSYDGGLKLLDPSNYDNNLRFALKGLMYSYCGSTAQGTYCGDGSGIIDIIRGGSKLWSGLVDAVKEKGWMNSAELAKAWNIQPGGIATQQWGWGDIREKIWDAYGEAGLPGNAAATTGATSITGGTASTGAMSGSLVGNAVLHKPQNDWLENVGLEGYIKNEVSLSGGPGGHIDTSAVENGQYANYASDAGAGSGLPGFIVLHLTSADNFGSRNWTNYCGDGFYCPPHFTIDVKKREIFQHFPLSHPSAALSKRGAMKADQYGIQIEIVGHGGDPTGGNYATCMAGACDSDHDYKNFTDEDYDYIASLLIAISKETGIPLTSSVEWGKTSHDTAALKIESNEDLKRYIGVLGHTHVNGKWDPLDIWYYIEPALARAGYAYSTSAFGNSVNCGGTTAFGSGECRNVPSNNGGCTEDGFTWFMQGGTADWAELQYGSCGYNTRMGSTACGPTAMAMIITALTGKMVTPDVVMQQSLDAGARVCGAGTDVTKLGPVAEQYGLQFQHVSDSEVTEQNVNQWLSEGKMMIFSVGPYVTEHGALTSGGHVIAIRGRASDGKWLTFNSAGGSAAGERSNWHFKPDDLLNAYLKHGRGNFCLVYR